VTKRLRTLPSIVVPSLAVAALGTALAVVVSAPARGEAPASGGDPVSLSGLRAGLSVADAAAVMDAWGVPWTEGDPRDFDGAGGGPVAARVLRLGSARSTPVGPVTRGFLLFLEGRLFWAELSVDAGLWRTRAADWLGRPAVRLTGSRLWVWPSRRTGAWATAREAGHDLTLAFYGTALDTGMMSDAEYRRALDELLAELASRGLPTDDR
jgi:hypothetical protein